LHELDSHFQLQPSSRVQHSVARNLSFTRALHDVGGWGARRNCECTGLQVRSGSKRLISRDIQQRYNRPTFSTSQVSDSTRHYSPRERGLVQLHNHRLRFGTGDILGPPMLGQGFVVGLASSQTRSESTLFWRFQQSACH
jgi:hypothetical protein